MTKPSYNLYTMDNSPYSDKIRALLRYKKIPFVEHTENLETRLDTALFAKLPSKPWETLYEGKELVFVKNTMTRDPSRYPEGRPFRLLPEKELQEEGKP